MLVAEDDLKIQGYIKSLLENAGHRVVAQATTLPEALSAVDNSEKLNVRVALIDGNLTPLDVSGSDGLTILAKIKSHAPYIKTVAISSSGIPGTDKHVWKPRIIDDLARVVTEL